jgi:hypothetical protein
VVAHCAVQSCTATRHRDVGHRRRRPESSGGRSAALGYS